VCLSALFELPASLFVYTFFAIRFVFFCVGVTFLQNRSTSWLFGYPPLAKYCLEAELNVQHIHNTTYIKRISCEKVKNTSFRCSFEVIDDPGTLSKTGAGRYSSCGDFDFLPRIHKNLGKKTEFSTLFISNALDAQITKNVLNKAVSTAYFVLYTSSDITNEAPCT